MTHAERVASASAMTLTEFLLARIAEDEAAVDVEGAFGDPGRLGVPDHPLVRWDHDQMLIGPSRVLAECDAKRRIVELHSAQGDARPCCTTCWEWTPMAYEDWPCMTIRMMALPYAGHPDYREEWRP